MGEWADDEGPWDEVGAFQPEHDIERWKRELREAGWTPKGSSYWRSPAGELYLGPYGAWQRMQQQKGATAEPPATSGDGA